MAKWTTAEVGDLSGRTIVITGASSGIGLVTARELARAGARVVLAVRNPDKGQRVAAEIAGETEVRQLDVASPSSVRRFATCWSGDIDVLINNAGIMDIPLTRTVEGLELQTATNYFGPFLLTNLLLPFVTDRVVSVTSQLHRMGTVDLDDLNWVTRPYKAMAAYQASKLELVLFSLELQRRLNEEPATVRSVLAHPGIANTNLVAHSPSNAIMKLGFLLNDAEHGALPTLFAATQEVAGNAYVGPRGLGSIKGHPKVRKPSTRGLDTDLAARLWAATTQLIESHS
jgi:NAD(P)-dependent dehydrogenase (short-subunit alcohol dehydrogenase family)